MELSVWIEARGHRKIRATHPTTLEITRHENITERGDCIVAIGADKGPADLPKEFKTALHSPGARISLVMEVEGQTASIRGRGSPGLPLSHLTDMVFRKSDFICPRTVMIGSDKAARDLTRDFVRLLGRPLKVVVELRVVA